MKDVIKSFGTMVSCAVGWFAGCWLWEEVLEDKVENFKENLANKRKEKGA